MIIKIELAEKTALLKEKVARAKGVELELVSDYDLSDIKVAFKNGQKVHELLTNQRTIAVPADVLFAGELQVKVDARIRGTVIKSWDIEPIILTESDNGFDSYGTITELTQRVTALESALEQLKAKVEHIEKDLTDVYDGLEC